MEKGRLEAFSDGVIAIIITIMVLELKVPPAWMGENNFTSVPVALYGLVLLFAGIAYFILSLTLISHHGKDSTLAIALGRDFKGKISIAIYAIAVPLAFINSLVAFMLHVLIAIVWLIPDRRIETAIDP